MIACWSARIDARPDDFNPYADPRPRAARRGISCTVAECAGLLETLFKHGTVEKPVEQKEE